VLAQIAIKNKFNEYVKYGPEIVRSLLSRDDVTTSEKYMAMMEDTVEALCGVINKILTEHTFRGVGYNACYELINNFMTEYSSNIVWDNM
jgi:hypothetical protein